MVLLEAAATGLPLITTAAGGAPEAVVPGRSGWVVAARDPSALAKKMLELMALTPDRRKAMGQEGRTHILSTFNVEAVLDTWQAVYSSMVGGTFRNRQNALR
jgi:glycosyltransferase involved in cell wall biosynthesis